MAVKILDNVKVNQNVLCWVLSYVGIAYAAPHPELACLCSLCRLLFVLCSVSVVSSLIVYSIAYWAHKWQKAKHPER